MTMEMFCDSDVETFSETSSDDQDDIFSIYSLHAQSLLSSLEDSIGKIDDFLSFERGFMHGDIVCSIGNPSGQLGKIVKVDMFVDLENVLGKVLKDVNSRKLLRMRSILVGDYVIRGPWLGRVEKVVDCVHIIFDDGTKSEIMATDSAKLLPLSPNLLDDSLYPYHPGQRVQVGHPNGSKPAGWLCGASKRNEIEGTVFSVEVGLVHVEWISSAIVDNKPTMLPPPCLQDPKNLTVLSCFSHANWQLGDWCVLPIADHCNETDVQHLNKSELGVRKRFDEMFSIIKKKVKVDVMWQDGKCMMGLDSQALFPVSVVNAHDFFPEQFVLEKISSDDLMASLSRRWGVVKSVDASERIVEVQWRGTTGDANDLSEYSMEETVSAYELVEHPDFSFGIGDIVFKSEKHHLLDQFSRMGMEELLPLGTKDCSTDLSETDEKYFLSYIGYVVGFIDGEIEVQWATEVITQVPPCKLVRVEKDDGPIVTHVRPDDNVTEIVDETAEYERANVEHQHLSDTMDGAAVSHQGDYRSSGFFSLSQVAMGFLTSITANFFRSHDTSLARPLSCAHMINEGKFGRFDDEDILQSSGMFTDISTLDDGNSEACGEHIMSEKIEKTALMPYAENIGLSLFKKFDVVRDCSDHHFVDNDAKASSQMRRGWLKKVQQEWTILEKDLPESVYVRIYEERMDLLRAAIVGASGTPYHDGLFFFDILLPPDYPQVPPLVHYQSGGLRLNPNLYESGKVCLSLINTWNGTGTEVWNPGSSTILQVLLSLQALVLNERPYFNEAGYDDQIGRAEGEKNSVSYNENAYLVTCKCMLYHLRKPPKHFEGLVEQHFEKSSQNILSTCKAYMEGAPIGFGSKAENGKGSSTGFKIMLAKLFPKLVEAFSDKGIDCSQFTEAHNLIQP